MPNKGSRSPSLLDREWRTNPVTWDACGVYFFVYREELVYVGMSAGLGRRISCHQASPWFRLLDPSPQFWWTETATLAEAIALEASLIREYRPTLNKPPRAKSLSRFNHVGT